MKVGCCSSRYLALLLLALLETAATLVSPEQCRALMDTCNNMAMSTLSVLGTGMESGGPITCDIAMMSGDMLEWHFTRTTIENASRVGIEDREKYSVSGEFSQILSVNNVVSNDEGYYFCRLRQNRETRSGTCLSVTAPAMFQTCSGDNVPQKGCSDTEQLTSTIGESVNFNIVLVHGGINESCNNQFIQMISLFKIGGPSSMTTLTDCPASNCVHNVSLVERLNVSRTPNEYNIIVTLSNLTEADNGSYSAIADVRRPPNSMRVCMYKNFTLTVSESPTTNAAPTTTSDETQTPISSTPGGSSPLSTSVLIGIAAVIVVLVLLLIGLGLFVAILLCWTYKNRHREKKGDMYETIRDVFNFRREKKNKSNGISQTEQEGVYRRSIVEEEKMNLPEVWNSDANNV